MIGQYVICMEYSMSTENPLDQEYIMLNLLCSFYSLIDVKNVSRYQNYVGNILEVLREIHRVLVPVCTTDLRL